MAVIPAKLAVASEHAAPYMINLLGGLANNFTIVLNETFGSHCNYNTYKTR